MVAGVMNVHIWTSAVHRMNNDNNSVLNQRKIVITSFVCSNDIVFNVYIINIYGSIIDVIPRKYYLNPARYNVKYLSKQKICFDGCVSLSGGTTAHVK